LFHLTRMSVRLVTALLLLALCLSTVHSVHRQRLRVLDSLDSGAQLFDDDDDDNDLSPRSSLTTEDMDLDSEDSLGEEAEEELLAEESVPLKKSSSLSASAQTVLEASTAKPKHTHTTAAPTPTPAAKRPATKSSLNALNKPAHHAKRGVGPACKGVRADGSCRPSISEPFTSDKRKLIKTYLNTVTRGKLTYHGGPVMVGPINIYYIFYGEWVQANPASGPILVDLARHLGNSAYHAQSLAYFQLAQKGKTAQNNSQSLSHTVNYAGSYYINSNHSLFVSDKLNDEQISSIISNSIEAKPPGWPAEPDPNGVYFFLLSVEVNATSGYCSDYCAYHNAMHLPAFPATSVKFAVVGNPASCPAQCAYVRKLPTPNGDWAVDALVPTLLNQLYKILTDPEPRHDAWVKTRGEKAGYETADLCALSFNSTQKDFATGARFNVEVGPRKYFLNGQFVPEISWPQLAKYPTNKVPVTGYCGIGPSAAPSYAETTAVTLTLVPSATKLVAGSRLSLQVQFAAQGTLGGPAPTGNIQVHRNGVPLRTYPVGNFVHVTKPLGVGAYIYSATYGGDNKYRSALAIVRVVVGKGQEAVVTLKIAHKSKGPIVAGNALSLKGTVTGGALAPTGTVTVISNKFPVVGCKNVSLTSKLTFRCHANVDTPGGHSYTAHYNGDANYNAADSTPVSIGSTTPTSMNLEVKFTPIALGQPAIFIAKIIGAGGSTPSSGVVAFYIDDQGLKNSAGTAPVTAGGIATYSLPTDSVVTGTHFMYAAYAGSPDQSFGPSFFTTKSVRFVINPALIPTKLEFSPLPSSLIYGQSVSLSVKVVPRQTSNFVITGTVTFTVNGVAAGPVTVAADSATATFQVLSVPLVVVAHYSGDPHFVSTKKHISTPVTVATTATVASVSDKSVPVGTQVTLTAKVTPQFPAPLTGVVTFFANKVQVGVAAAVSPQGEASLVSSSLAAGKYVIQAKYKDTLGHFSTSDSPATVDIGAPELEVTGDSCLCSGKCPATPQLYLKDTNSFVANSTVLTATDFYDNFALNLPSGANVTVLLTSTRGTTVFFGSFDNAKLDKYTQTAEAGAKLNFGMPPSAAGNGFGPYYFEAYCAAPRCRYSLQLMYTCPTPCMCGTPGSYTPPAAAAPGTEAVHPNLARKSQRPANYKTHLEATYFHNTGHHLNAPEPLEPAN
jgi:hypothetical protein